MRTSNARVAVSMLALVLATSSVSSNSGRSAATCATDPASQFLEQLQRDAYGIDIYWRGALDTRRETAELVAREFPNGMPGLPAPHLKASLKALRLPTCYEDRLWFNALKATFRLLQDVAGQVVPSARRPANLAFGTMPSFAVNAGTYYTTAGLPVVVFNNSLLNFAVFESNVAVTAVATGDASRQPEASNPSEASPAAVDIRRATAAMESLLLEFLYLPGVRDERSHDLNEHHGAQIASIMDGMMTFVAAHEYAHVLLGHHAEIRRVAPPIDGPASTLATAVWSWPQETSADELGVRLMDAMVRRKDFLGSKWRDQWPAVLRAAPLLLQYFEMIEESMMWRKARGEVSPLGARERDTIRALSLGQPVTAEDAARLGSLEDHPPAWARQERVMAQVNSLVLARLSTEAERRADLLAQRVLGWSARWWQDNQSRVERIVESVARGEPIEVTSLAGLRVSLDSGQWGEMWSGSPRMRTFRHRSGDARFTVAWTDQHLSQQWLADAEINLLRPKVPDISLTDTGHQTVNGREFDVRRLDGTVDGVRVIWLHYNLVTPGGAVELVMMTESTSFESRRRDLEHLVATVH